MYDAMEIVAEKTKEDALDVFTTAPSRTSARLLEVKARRVGGATYQVPIEVRRPAPPRSPCAGSSTRPAPSPASPMAERLAEEILAANKKEGIAFKKREDTHKMAEANRAFAHYRW